MSFLSNVNENLSAIPAKAANLDLAKIDKAKAQYVDFNDYLYYNREN